ncbi:unnamed protein product [Spirodela intermedia]|uniref:Uncharacterized protein n=1 Tax=Spirodela intermedia TaxID=51605 RepID=A0A7I8JDV1_SPIIN|nr:unnamed protein product [Spirodela intermedia]CAA6668328.1 unnamed protein product [Spirodela intermedia]
MRVLMNCVAFAFCFANKKLFVGLYFLIFLCDGLDGWFARKLNQVSTFGAALDMVTDRVSTACLLVILSHIYSHWLQMYRAYYRHRLLMGFCCWGLSNIIYMHLLVHSTQKNTFFTTKSFLHPCIIEPFVSVLAMKMAADAYVSHEMKRGM